MQRFRICSFFLCCIVLPAVPGLEAQDPPAAIKAYVPADVPNSVAGFQSQVDELIRAGKTHDQATWIVALGTFVLPNPATWFEAAFASQHVAQLTQAYPGT